MASEVDETYQILPNIKSPAYSQWFCVEVVNVIQPSQQSLSTVKFFNSGEHFQRSC